MPLILHTRVVSGSGGGPDKTILNSPRFLEDRGYRVLCAYMRHPEDPGFARLERRARQWDAPLVAVDDHGPFDLGVLGRMRSLCEIHHPALWHAHDYKSNLLGLMVRRRYPMRLVTTVHGWVERTWKTPVYYRVDRLCLRYYDAVVCVSEDLYAMCREAGVAEGRLWHVPNAVDTEEFRRAASVQSAKARFGVPRGRLVIGAVGRLSREKGYELLLRAIRRLCHEGLDVELWIAGDGRERARLGRLVAEMALRDRVKLLGYRADTVDLYHAMDVFVSSSLREGLPNVLLEAMALEVPVLCTRIAGAAGLIRDSVNGLLVEAGSEEAIVEGLRRLVGDSMLRLRLGAAARKTIERSYPFRQRMEKIRAVYDQVLKGREAAA